MLELFKLFRRWLPETPPARELSECFACMPRPVHHEPMRAVRVLCPEHSQTAKTLGGESLAEVVEALGSPEGAPLQWLVGPLSLELPNAKPCRGWCLYVPAVYLVAEDRFGAASWLHWWLTDLSLQAADFHLPALDALATSVEVLESSTLLELVVAAQASVGRQGQDLVEHALSIWQGERQAPRRRDGTGRVWPTAEQLQTWLAATRACESLAIGEQQAFVRAFTDGLGHRAQWLAHAR